MTDNMSSAADADEDITKLNLANFKGKLYGRSKELSILMEVYHRVSASSSVEKKNKTDENEIKDDITAAADPYLQSSSELVLVSGSSGVGKSALVEKLKEECASSNNHSASGGVHYFVSGKFNQLHDSQPYSAVSAALNELCNAILQDQEKCSALTTGDKDKASPRIEIASAIKEALGTEGLRTLAPNVPKLNNVLESISGIERRFRETEKSSVNKLLRARDGFLFNLLAFVRAVCSECCILVLFLDDLQWADEESIRLIRSLLTDTQTRNLLFVGAYREEEVDMSGSDLQTKFLAECIQDIEKNAVNLTRIQLGNLDKESVNLLISDVLRLDANETMPLAQIVHKSTHGNIFFVLRFLESLQEENLLKFSFHTCRWTWASDDKIKSTVNISCNVADLMVKKVQQLQPESLLILVIASCLGFHFDEDLLKYIIASWQDNFDESINVSLKSKDGSFFNQLRDVNLELILAMAVEEGFLDRIIGTGSVAVYKFSHDRVHQAAFSILSGKKETCVFHLNIGELLLKRYSSLDETARGENQFLLFSLVDQLNEAWELILDTGKRIELAEYNLEAAEAAATSSAFVPASAYLKQAIKLLDGTNSWMEHYDLVLKISNASAMMDYCTGNMESCECTVKKAIKNAKSCQEKIEAYSIYMALLLSREDLKDMMNVGFQILAQLGEKLPRKVHWYNIYSEFSKTKKVLHNMTADDLLAVPVVRNEEKSAAIEILEYLFGSCCLLRSEHLPLIICRVIQLSVKHGMCEASPCAFAMYGALLCGRWDVKSGARFGQIALSIQEKVGDNSQELTTFIVHYFLNFWSEHLQMSLDPLLNSYKTGVRSGNMLFALLCAQVYCECYLCCGMPLAAIEKDMRQYRQVAVDYEQTMPLNLLLPIWQFTLNLLGRSENPLQLKGEAMDFYPLLEYAVQSNNIIVVKSLWCMQIELAYLFDDLDLAVDFMASAYPSSPPPDKNALPSLRKCRFTCVFGLIALAMARKTQKTNCLDQTFCNTQHRKWVKRSLRIMKQVKKWVECNAGNFLHSLLLMNAEYDALSKSEEAVKKSFDVAISTAGRNGFPHDQALANERAGIYFLEKGDNYWASFYLSQSHELYDAWGAQAKVSHIKEKYSSLLELAEDKQKMKGHRGKPRFTNATKTHQKIDVVGICQRHS